MIASTRLLPRRRRQSAWVLAVAGAPLQAAAETLVRVDELRAGLLAAVSHELRTFITEPGMGYRFEP